MMEERRQTERRQAAVTARLHSVFLFWCTVLLIYVSMCHFASAVKHLQLRMKNRLLFLHQSSVSHDTKHVLGGQLLNVSSSVQK